MTLEKQLADTDSVYCTKVTNSNQSSIFISNLGNSELDALFGADYKSDDAVRLRLNRRNLAFNAVAHVVDGRTWYKRKSSDKWDINAAWLSNRLSTLADVFTSDEGVFIAYLNKDDYSTHRLYMKGMSSLQREDGGKNIALRDFLFSGDVVVLTKLENGDVSFEIKIPDNPVISYIAKYGVDGSSIGSEVRQLIIYGAPGTGKSHKIDMCTNESNSIRVTFHPDTDYAAFVGTYKPFVSEAIRYGLNGANTVAMKVDGADLKEDKIIYKFVPQAFMKAYVEAWRRYTDTGLQGDAKTYYLVIEEINRGNCAQIFGDLFQLLDRADNGFSAYAITPDDDIQKFLETDKDYKLSDIPLTADIKKMTENGEKVIATAADIKTGKKLVLPPNLYIWATMNTSDQSLFPMDSAFKRRWEWEYVPITKHSDKDYKIKIGSDQYDWWDFLTAINDCIWSATDSEDKKLGYFFVKAQEEGGKNLIMVDRFVNKVIFYLWNDVFKNSDPEKAFKFKNPDGKDVLVTFQEFFNKDDGKINEGVVKRFIEGLGVKPDVDNSSPSASAQAAPAENL